ncbi:uncharacterized protein LOC120294089 [Eucalyptus grandis]|uniref:uncharacterized protein LOC120294089 n=1 Tax=Eucalyptus grandis TaxID=71139 RepID=UPI00192E801E|nr:uncharacterized protein LOC120294089 [Eucalyptus grandis]
MSTCRTRARTTFFLIQQRRQNFTGPYKRAAHLYTKGQNRETRYGIGQSGQYLEQVLVADLFSEDGRAIRAEIESWGSPLPSLSGTQDRFCWREDSMGLFSVASPWEALRRKKARVNWHCFIWSNAILPRYQLNLWLITNRRLPTQSLLMSYGRIDAVSCPFCNEVHDSINHLFFGCRITSSIAFFWATRCNLPRPTGLGRRLSVGPLPCSAARSFISVLPGSPLGRVTSSRRNKNNILFGGAVIYFGHEEASPQGC